MRGFEKKVIKKYQKNQNQFSELLLTCSFNLLPEKNKKAALKDLKSLNLPRREIGILTRNIDDEKIRQEIERKYLIEMNLPISLSEITEQNDVFKVIQSLGDTIFKDLRDYLSKYSKEEVLFSLLYNASVLSILSHGAKGIYIDISNDPLSKTNSLIINLLETIGIDTRGFFGSFKSATEFLINYTLYTESTFLNNTDYRGIDFQKLYGMVQELIYLNEIKRNFSRIYKNETKVEINETIYIKGKYQEQIEEYFIENKKVKIELDNEETTIVYDEFEKAFGYSPKDIENYVALNFLKKYGESFVVAIDKKSLMEEIMSFLKLDSQSVSHLLDNLTLETTADKIDYFKLNNSKYERLYRAPLIPIKDYNLIPTYTLVEACYMFRYRILKGDIKGNNGEFNLRLLQEYYDETDLIEFKYILENKGIKTKINQDFQKHSELNELLKGISKIKKETDLIFNLNNGLYIVEYKNHGIQHSFGDVNKSITRTNKELAKMHNLKHFILNNKSKVGEFLGWNFESNIKLILVHKYTNFSSEELIDTKDIRIFDKDKFLLFLEGINK